MPRHNFQLGWEDRRPFTVFIYALVDPRTDTIRYVGRTEDLKRRFQHHITGGRSSRAVQAWVRELQQANSNPRIETLTIVRPGDDADEAEYMAIRGLRRHGYPLLNDFSVELRAHRRRRGTVAPPSRAATTVRARIAEQVELCRVAQVTEPSIEAIEPVRIRIAEPFENNSSHIDTRSELRALTGRQARGLQLIIDSILARGYPMTIREIGEALGIRSTNGVIDHLRALERKGYLERSPNQARGLKVLRTVDGRPFERRVS